jgi:peptidoglycan/xylan/chitin deacetylase (PgdA/CDA1 family)
VPKRPDNQVWRYWRTVIGVVAAGAVLVIGGLTGHVTRADNGSCAVVKCVALTFDDGPGPFDERLLQILKDNDAKATFFLIGNKVAANPAGAKRIADAGMEIGNHTWEHPNMTTLPPASFPGPTTRSPPRPAGRRACIVPPADCPTPWFATPPVSLASPKYFGM